METHTETLMSQLGEDRDYGLLSFETVKERIEDGSISIEIGQKHPVLRDAETGQILRGSGPTLRSGIDMRDVLASMADIHLEQVIESLVEQARNGDIKAAIYLIDRWCGRYTEPKKEPSFLDEMLEEKSAHRRVFR
jgi:hypothetical protein